jgi:hypothetical protein
MNVRLLGSVFRLRRLAQEFNHFWSYAVNIEDLAEIYHQSANFAEFKENLGKLCAELNIAPVGGCYLQDATYDNGWLAAFFGGSNQLKVMINPDKMLIRVEYTNGQRGCSAVYNDTNGKLTWESPPQTARDAVRVLRVIAVLAELDPYPFVRTHLPERFDDTDEADLYTKVRWTYLWINPQDLKDILSAR